MLYSLAAAVSRKTLYFRLNVSRYNLNVVWQVCYSESTSSKFGNFMQFGTSNLVVTLKFSQSKYLLKSRVLLREKFHGYPK